MAKRSDERLEANRSVTIQRCVAYLSTCVLMQAKKREASVRQGERSNKGSLHSIAQF